MWKSADPQTDNIPSLVVETYLDLRDLGPQHSLILTDVSGKQWEVTKGKRRSEVVLERWLVEFIPAAVDSDDWEDSTKESQPTSIYKQAIILIRSLYTYTHLLPAWALRKRLLRSKLTVSPLKVGCRILNGSRSISSKGRVGLTKRIKELSDPETKDFTFSDLKTPLGHLRVSVSYRYECNFSVSDMESVLSNHFYDLDKSKSVAAARRQSYSTAPFNPASLPSPSRSLEGSSMASRINVYRNHTKHASSNSSSEFPEAAAAAISSPTDFVARDRRLSNLSLRDSATYSPLMTQHSGTPPIGSVPSSQSPTSARPSVSFIQPFKTPSLSASPIDSNPSSRPPSFSRNPSNSSLAASLRIPGRSLSNASNSSVHSYLRGSPTTPNDNAISSSVSSSRSSSMPKFSSSFGSRGNWQRSGSISSTTRPKRFSNPGEPGSVGSVSSVTEPGSSFLVDDDDGLGEFVQMVDSIGVAKAKTSNSVLLSGGSSGSNSSVLFGSKTAAGAKFMGSGDTDVLSKFQNMRGSYSALSDSLQGSHNRSSESSISPSATGGSYPIPNNSPPQVSKVISQHTPSIPSRLSEEFTANDSFKAYYYSHPRKQGSISSLRVDEEIYPQEGDESDMRGHRTSGSTKINPLDIPLPNSLTRGHTRRESLSVNTRREMADLPERHHQSLGAPGHIFPGKELSSFRFNAAAEGQGEEPHHGQAPVWGNAAGNAAARRIRCATDTGYSPDALAQQVGAVNLSSESRSSSSMSRRPSRFSYYLEENDEDDDLGKAGRHDDDGINEDDGGDEDDVFFFALSEEAQTEGSGSGPSAISGSGTRYTGGNMYDALAWE